MNELPTPEVVRGASGDPADGSVSGDVGVTVAVVTYRRPELLVGVLEEILDQAETSSVPVDVVVVDNDPDGSAKDPVSRLADARLRYVHEPRPGLAAGRNAALDAAVSSRLLAFVDDDNRPRPGWLSALIETWATWRADAVTGPLEREIAPGAEPWVLACGFFDRVSRTTGERVPGAKTGNLLLDLRTVRQLEVRFDERFGLSGGEDTMFTRTMIARGAVIRWCDEAVVCDPVPSERLTRRWVLSREFRIGSTWSRVRLALAEKRVARARQVTALVGIGVGSFGRGAARTFSGWLSRSLSLRAGGEREVARSIGILVGVLDLRVEQYRRHGPALRFGRSTRRGGRDENIP